MDNKTVWISVELETLGFVTMRTDGQYNLIRRGVSDSEDEAKRLYPKCQHYPLVVPNDFLCIWEDEERLFINYNKSNA